MSKQKPVLCHYCNKQIWPNMSRFEGHETAVCQQCYKDKDQICFNCRFPILKDTKKTARICKFCKPDLTAPGFTLQNIEPILDFISKYWSLPKDIPNIQWISILRLSEIQENKTVDCTDESLDLFIQSFYPVFFMDKTIFTYQEITNSWFIPYFGGPVMEPFLAKAIHRGNIATVRPIGIRQAEIARRSQAGDRTINSFIFGKKL